MDIVSIKRIFYLLSWFAFGLVLVAVPMLAFAIEYPANVRGVFPYAGELYYRGPGQASGQPIYPGTEINSAAVNVPRGPVTITHPSSTISTPVKVPLPSVAGVPAGNQVIQVSTKIVPNAARVASSVVALAKSAGPVGLGIQLATVLCQTTDICTKSDDLNVLVKKGPDLLFWTVNSDGPFSVSAESSCQAYVSSVGRIYDSVAVTSPTSFVCRFTSYPYSVYGGKKTGTGVVSEMPLTQSDLDVATKKLTDAIDRHADLVDGLQKQGQPVPIDKPELSPRSETSPPTTTVNRDKSGNIINTTTTTTTTNISPVVNSSTSNTVNITQITNTTMTGPTGVVTGTTQTDSTPPEPDDPDISFDDVPDVNLENQELPLSMPAASSWGEGSCPPDPSVSVLGHPVAVPVHVVCDYMIGVRGAVIALFALISAYIVIGVKFEG